MSYFDDASLVMIPSGYKTSKVYSVKPTDGSGDLTFSRSNDTATRVGPNGLIEKVRTNLLTYSQDFSNAAWIVDAGLTKTLNQTDPNGGTTAALFSGTSGSNLTVAHTVTLAANVPSTISIYIKGSSSGSVSLRIDDSTVGPQYDINYTTSWQRFSVTRTVNQTGCAFVVGGYSTWGVGENIYLAFGQAETGDIATDYIATTSAAVSVGPVANVPRLDYLGSTCPRLLLEPQRTNLALFSEQFNNVAWIKNGATITANTATSPDGFTNADTLEKAGGSGGSDYFYIITSISSNTTNTGSFFVKYKEGSGIIWLLGKNSETFAFFNVQTGTALSATAGMTTKIENYGNGWYRCSFTQDYTGAGGTLGIGLCLVDGTPSYNATSAATQGVYIYGAQMEAGAYATSYIPTLGAAVTRGADACSKTGISSLIGQTEGVLFYDFVWNGNPVALGDYPVIIYGASYSDFLGLSTYESSPSFYSYVGGSNVVAIGGATMVVGQRYKMAMAYKLNDYAFYVNGSLVGVDTSAGIPASMANLRTDSPFGGRVTSTGINQALLFPTRLSNADLATLTTL